MNKLTKAQVLALFLGVTYAQPPGVGFQPMFLSDLLNKPSSTDNVPEGQKLTPAMTGSPCAANTDCTQEGEKCAQAQIDGSSGANSLCIAEGFCKGLGKLNGAAYYLACYEDVVAPATAAPPAAVNPAEYLSAVEEFITLATVNWNSEENMIVSAKFNHQDGWFVEKDGKWTEVDKSPDNRCLIAQQCEADECCGYWPDANARRCMKTALDKVEQTAGPITFTPSCAPNQTPGEAPESAQDDIAKGKLSEASGETDKFFNNEKADKQAAAKYDEMSEDEKAEFDKKLDALDAKRAEFKDALKAVVGFNGENFGIQCQAIFEEEYLKYEKVRYEDCAKDEDSLYCEQADELVKRAFTAMKGDGTAEAKNYFCGDSGTEMNDEDRVTWKAAYNEQREKDGAALVALSVENGGPKAGEDGFSCGANGQCPVGSCCGNSKPSETQVMAANQVQGAISAWIDKLDAGATDLIKEATGIDTGSLVLPEGTIQNICVDMNDQGINLGTQQEWTPIFDVKMIHTCQAIAKLATSAAAAGAALYYM